MDKNEKISSIKNMYEVEIPDELSDIVQNTIKRAELELQQEENKERERLVRMKKMKKMKKQISGIAAAVVIMAGAFGVGVNYNEAFAATVSDIPVLNSLAKVFTVEKIHEETESYVADMKIPGIEGLKDEKLQKQINELVYSQVTAATDETKAVLEEYKQAFLETGGTEDEFMQQEILVDYEVKCLNEEILSFSVYKMQTLASAYSDLFYYNYDLTTSSPLTLEKMLGSNYKEIANEQIKKEIAERSKAEDAVYWDGSYGTEGFSTISEDQQFYVNKKGNPVIVFNKYEIAPGYMGIQEFEITK